MSSIKKIRTTEGDLAIDYNSLDNRPTIPSKTSDLTNDSNFITKSVGNLDNYYTKSEVDAKEVEVTLNGASVSSPSFYAPTTAGTSGQVLKSSGSGAPVWGTVDMGTKEDKSNKVTSMSSSSTDTQYPSAKCVYDNLNEINGKFNYTQEEQRIGTWIDGKPLYRIVASINLQNYSSWTNLVHISNLKRVINIYGSLNNINIPRYESSSYFTQFLYENNYIKVMCNGNTGGGYLVIEYTKTTD